MNSLGQGLLITDHSSPITCLVEPEIDAGEIVLGELADRGFEPQQREDVVVLGLREIAARLKSSCCALSTSTCVLTPTSCPSRVESSELWLETSAASSARTCAMPLVTPRNAWRAVNSAVRRAFSRSWRALSSLAIASRTRELMSAALVDRDRELEADDPAVRVGCRSRRRRRCPSSDPSRSRRRRPSGGARRDCARSPASRNRGSPGDAHLQVVLRPRPRPSAPCCGLGRPRVKRGPSGDERRRGAPDDPARARAS